MIGLEMFDFINVIFYKFQHAVIGVLFFSRLKFSPFIFSSFVLFQSVNSTAIVEEIIEPRVLR
jgi:hypothetical protein